MRPSSLAASNTVSPEATDEATLAKNACACAGGNGNRKWTLAPPSTQSTSTAASSFSEDSPIGASRTSIVAAALTPPGRASTHRGVGIEPVDDRHAGGQFAR